MNIDQKWRNLSDIHAWELYSESLKTDYEQSIEEGKDVAFIENLVNTVCAMQTSEFKEELSDLIFKEMQKAPMRADYEYDEPSDLEEIKAKRPQNRMEFGSPEKNKELEDKIKGAWLGRICGCLLGKPIEGWKRKDIKAKLEETGNYPLSRYIFEDYCKGYAPVDDDTNYTVMAAYKIIGAYGRDFKPNHVMEAWISSQSRNAYCTAERAAFINFMAGIHPPLSAIYKNPYREWIGAQIRADYFGYINPGKPEKAAEMAWRDASISHIKNGIYGEMFVAAMIAAAAVCDDIKSVLQAGLEQIPENSRLTESVKQIINLYDSGVSAEECFEEIHKQWNEYNLHHWCHTISNAMICTAALLYGNKDYAKTICLSVETGFDTDCNGATVGSIIGMMTGVENIPEYWSKPINGVLATSIFGFDKIKVSDLVQTTISHME